MKKPRQFQGASVSHLILGAVSMVRSRWYGVTVFAITFALLMAATSTFTSARIQTIETDIALRAGMTEDALMEKVSVWTTETTDFDLIKFAARHNQEGFSFSSAPTPDNAPMLYVLRTGPYVLGLLLFDFCIFFLTFIYFLVFFSDPLLSAYDAAKRFPLTIVRFVGLLFWMFIRSFFWIPFVGPFIAMYFFPRFILSPSLVASGDTGVRESIHLSMARTSGHWFSILGRLVLLLLLSLLLLWIIVVMASVTSLFFLKIGFLLWLIGLLFVISFQAAYLVVLTAILI